jgi:hypothetical protein
MTTLTELQQIFDTDFPNVTLDKKQVNVLFKQAAQAKSFADQFKTVISIIVSDFKIDKKTQSELLKYAHILNLVQVMNKRNNNSDDKLNEAYSEAINTFRDNKLNSILN